MSTPPTEYEMTNAEKLINLANVGLHITEDGKLQDLFGGRKKSNGPRDTTTFTDKELIQLREWCLAGCAQYGEDGLDNAGVFEKLESFVSLAVSDFLLETLLTFVDAESLCCDLEEEVGGGEEVAKTRA